MNPSKTCFTAKTGPFPTPPLKVVAGGIPIDTWTYGVIDLSHHDTIDADSGFHDMKAAGIQAIIHKATEGQTVVDATYAPRRPRAASTGLHWGSYHFATDNGGGKDQCDHYLKWATPTEKDVVCLDWEENNGKFMSRKEAEAFVLHCCAMTGRWPLLYTGDSFVKEQMKGVVDSPLYHCPLWIAAYPFLKPTPKGWKATQPILHQYSESGSVAGVSGKCDRNRYRGGTAQLDAKWPNL